MSHSSLWKAQGVLLILIIIISICVQVKAISWSVNTRRLTTSAGDDTHPAITQTKDRRIWLVWSREIQGNLKLHYKTSSDFGVNWSQEKNLTDLTTQGQDQNPQIMQAYNGTIWLVWTSDRVQPQPPTPDFRLDASPQNLTVPNGESDNSTIIVTSINDFSETVDLTVLSLPTEVTALFEPSQVTPLPNQTANSTLTLTAGATATPGNYTITVLGSSDHLMHIVNVYLEIPSAGGTGQTSIQTLSLPLNTDAPSIPDYELYYKTSHDNGATWSKDTQLTNNNVDDLKPAVIQLANGTIMIVWQSYVLDNHEICYTTTNDGTTWSNMSQLTTDSAHDKGPAVMQTKGGEIWIAWSSARTGNYDIFYTVYNGSLWSTAASLPLGTDFDIQPAIVQAINGDIFIFWASDAGVDYDVNYVFSTNNGTNWSDTAPFAASGYEDMWPAVMRDRDTKIWVTWTSNQADQPDGNWEIYIKTSLPGDINGDGITNIVDLTIVSLSFGLYEGDPGYNSDADLNKDGRVEMRDMWIVSYYMLET